MTFTDNMGYGCGYNGLSAADVAAVMNSNNGCNNGWGGDGAWWFIILILALCGGGWGLGGFGGAGMMGMGMMDGMMMYPWMNQVDVTTSGFQNQATNTAISSLQNSVTSGFGDVQLGIAGINQNLCQTGGNITAALNNGFNAAEIAANGRQMANMQQQFALQQQIAQCCCDDQLATAGLNATILSEGCANREVANNNARDLLVSGTANTQRIVDVVNGGFQTIMDKLCQNEINDLRTQLNDAKLQASQTAQTRSIEQYIAGIGAYYNGFGGYGNGCCNNGATVFGGC